MSTTNKQPEEAEFDFWEFVACARCHQPFLPDSGGPPSIPFWITECGHVVCNNHLKPNKTCSKCGSQNVQVAPLQREMEAPMSNWFNSVPQSLDTVAFATRFQFETLGSLVRYYKRKCSQHRALIERLKNDVLENKELKRVIEELTTENERLRQYGDGPSEVTNAHGKRPMVDVHRHTNGSRTNSSPRSVMTPVGPNRLTLPPSHQQPSFAPKGRPSDGMQNGEEYPQSHPPGSRRLALEQYAYVSPNAQRTRKLPAPLTHNQSVSIRQGSVRRQSYGQPEEQAHIAMMPPPLPSGMRDEAMHHGSRAVTNSHPVRRGMGHAPNGPRLMPAPIHQPIARHPQQPGSLRPPATPLDMSQHGVRMSRRLGESSSTSDDHIGGSLQSNRYSASALPTQRFVPPTPSGRQRFSTPAPLAGPSHSGLMRTSTDLGPRVPSRATGGQRMPFIPGGNHDFN